MPQSLTTRTPPLSFRPHEKQLVDYLALAWLAYTVAKTAHGIFGAAARERRRERRDELRRQREGLERERDELARRVGELRERNRADRAAFEELRTRAEREG